MSCVMKLTAIQKFYNQQMWQLCAYESDGRSAREPDRLDNLVRLCHVS